ncbi:hypothetical protein ACTMSW_29825 [Micromonospora sp. BQ11]|uniref:hypothetical protein n=1 Tax=Micromonospora sp. BQ11 TaxID=3452212 RepID=UPI003F8C50AE
MSAGLALHSGVAVARWWGVVAGPVGRRPMLTGNVAAAAARWAGRGLFSTDALWLTLLIAAGNLLAVASRTRRIAALRAAAPASGEVRVAPAVA